MEQPEFCVQLNDVGKALSTTRVRFMHQGFVYAHFAMSGREGYCLRSEAKSYPSN